MRVMTSLRYLLLFIVVFSTLLLDAGSPASAGCGCDKPPPAPAPVIPHVAFGRMKITLFHETFQEGQQWSVVFRNGTAQSPPRYGKVVLRRDISDITGQTITPRLIVSIPPNAPPGPTSITVSKGSESFTIPASDFTVIGAPVTVSEKRIEFTKAQYTTAVGADGTLYFSLDGLAKVCQPMKFKALMEGNPLRFTNNGQIAIINGQGFLVESLACSPGGCTPLSHYFPESNIGDQDKSDRMEYWRHSFEQYCLEHKPGGAKTLDPKDRNWHKDGTPHVDYSTLIFAVTGHYDSGLSPDTGKIIFDLNVESKPDDLQGGWEDEKEEESVNHQ